MKRVLTTILIVVILAGLATSIAVPLWFRARRRSQLTQCASNLSSLWKMQWVYRSQFSRMPFIRATGKGFWLSLSKTEPLLIDPSNDVYGCPVRGGWRPGVVHYLGPIVDVNKLSEADLVGCDEMNNHSPDGSAGGNFIRKSGDVLEIRGPEWLQLFRDSRCKP